MMGKTGLFACLAVGLLLSLPVYAQEPVPVSGSFNYTPEIFTQVSAGNSQFFDASEDEVWTGDIKGTAVSPFRMVITPDGVWDAWLYTKFEGTVLGKYKGTMVLVSRYKRLAPDAHWAGEWIILSGTGDLEHVQGHGTAWGPGFNAKDPEAGPDIFFSGEVVLQPSS
jgi:hypothetical protein